MDYSDAYLRLVSVLQSIFRRLCGVGNMNPSKDSEFDEESLKKLAVSRDFKTGHPELVRRVKELIASYQRMFPNRQVVITCVYRSPEEQRRLWNKGRNGNPGPIVTNCDGIQKRSQHNFWPSRAVDVAIVEGGKVVWDEVVYYPLGPLSKQVGLEWGGFWAKFQDYPHLELGREVA